LRIAAVIAFASVALLAPAAYAAATPAASDVQTFSNYLSARQAASELDLKEASKYYALSLANDPDNKDILAKAFIYAASSGDIENGAKLAKRVVATQPDNRLAQLVIVVDTIERGRFADARAMVDPTANEAMAKLDFQLMNIWASMGAGDSEGALAVLKKMKGIGGADAIADYHLALVYDQLGRVDEADAAYRQALIDVGPAPRIVDAYGRFLERAGRSAEATMFYTKLQSEDALRPIIDLALARIAAKKKPDPLIPNAQAGAAEAMFGIGASLTDNATADLAVLYLHCALYLRPDLDLAKVLLADRLENLRKYDEALAVYSTIGKSSIYYRVAAVQAAVDMARIKRGDDAVATLKALVADQPSDLEVWTALGDVYRSLERYGDATQAYTQAINTIPNPGPKNWQLYYARAIAEQQSDDWAAAEADLQTALKLSPDEPDVLNNLGYSWVEKKQNIPKALVMLEKARTLRPFDGYIVDSVGWAYYSLGKYDEAAKTLLNAVLLVPGDPTINEHLGDAYWRVGKKLDAQFQWSHALAFTTDDKTKPSLEGKLKDGLPPAPPPVLVPGETPVHPVTSASTH
jgi:tetratricopeptide (TPR) repeat protein